MNKIDIASLKLIFIEYDFIDITDEIKSIEEYEDFVMVAVMNPYKVYIINNETEYIKNIIDILKHYTNIPQNVSTLLLNKDNYQCIMDNNLNKTDIINKFLEKNNIIMCAICTQVKNKQIVCNKCGEFICYSCIIKFYYIDNKNKFIDCPCCKKKIKLRN
jgi:hypothetical protein